MLFDHIIWVFIYNIVDRFTVMVLLPGLKLEA